MKALGRSSWTPITPIGDNEIKYALWRKVASAIKSHGTTSVEYIAWQ